MENPRRTEEWRYKSVLYPFLYDDLRLNPHEEPIRFNYPGTSNGTLDRDKTKTPF